MRIGVIINPAAGTRDALRLQKQVEAFCARSGAELDLRIHNRLARIESVAHSLAPNVDMIGVVGGDGTLNGVINGILTSARPDVPICFMPAGRGKDVARTLPSWTIDHLDQRLPNHRLVQIDIGLATLPDGETRYFVNESSIGIGAFAARSASNLPRAFGSASYLLGTLHGLIRERPFTAELDIEGTGVVELPRCHNITIANGRYFGGGLQIAPRANACDGLLDIVAIADAGTLEVTRALPHLFRGTHLTHPAVFHWQTSGVSVQTVSPTLLESDGEQWNTSPARFSISKHALTWVEPQ